MKIELDKTLDLPLSPRLAWDLLQDIEGVATCLPGAKITEQVDETHYKGTVTVRLGPATVAFKGTIEIAARDAVAHRMRIIGKGSDAGGGSAASLDMVAWIEAGETGGSILKGHSEISVSGKIASFGARLMNSASEVLIKQFFDNMLARATAVQAAPAADAKFNLIAFIWAVTKDYLRKLFGRAGTT